MFFQITEDSRCLSVNATEIIHSLLEEDFTMSALNHIHNNISRRYMPQAKTMKILLFHVLQVHFIYMGDFVTEEKFCRFNLLAV